MGSPRFNSVQHYLASLEPVKAKTLGRLIDFLLSRFPELESTISWNVPQLRRDGKYVVGVAAFKNHLTFAPWSPRVIERFRPKLSKFVVKTNCFQIPLDWEIDKGLLTTLVQARLAELGPVHFNISHMSTTNPKVDFYFQKAKHWKDEYAALRKIALDRGLVEELKWGCPCYTLEQSNIVLIHGFKDYCALLFFKGALLKDANRILIQQTKNVQAGRQIRFTNIREIVEQKAVLKVYIDEAIAVEKAGLKVTPKKTPEPVPEEFQEKLDEMPALKKAFAALTPGRQRGYLLHFSGAKQSKTRAARVEKWIPQILNGKGLDDE
jgi:uncharacterized protein YdeI (YjbR/CyaY-like superfamily)/uncharacterized protein YdhG (YjbR/CyaY superfamily)